MVTATNFCSDIKINTCGKTAKQFVMGALTGKCSMFPIVNNSLAFCLHVWNQRGRMEDKESKQIFSCLAKLKSRF